MFSHTELVFCGAVRVDAAPRNALGASWSADASTRVRTAGSMASGWARSELAERRVPLGEQAHFRRAGRPLRGTARGRSRAAPRPALPDARPPLRSGSARRRHRTTPARGALRHAGAVRWVERLRPWRSVITSKPIPASAQVVANNETVSNVGEAGTTPAMLDTGPGRLQADDPATRRGHPAGAGGVGTRARAAPVRPRPRRPSRNSNRRRCTRGSTDCAGSRSAGSAFPTVRSRTGRGWSSRRRSRRRRGGAARCARLRRARTRTRGRPQSSERRRHRCCPSPRTERRARAVACRTPRPRRARRRVPRRCRPRRWW